MKVLQININSVGGSTGKIVTDLKNVLENDGHECTIAYGNGITTNKPGYFRYCYRGEQLFNNVLSRITGLPYGGYGFLSTSKLIRFINDYEPDVVHVHCPNGCTIDLYKLVTYLGKSRHKTILTNHAEYWYTANCGHSFDCDKWRYGCGNCPSHPYIKRFLRDNTASSWQRMKRSFDSFAESNLIITSVSPWVTERSKSSPYLNRFRHVTVENGLDTTVFHPRDPIQKFGDRPIVFHATAHFSNSETDIKGGRFIIELAKRMPDVLFIVASLAVNIDKNILPSNLLLWGCTNSQEELSKLYSTAACTVLTSNRETFSMTTAESLCCGTPIVGFYAGGPETIALSEYSSFVKFGDVAGLESAIRLLLMPPPNRIRISQSAALRYSKERMTAQYLDLYKELTGK